MYIDGVQDDSDKWDDDIKTTCRILASLLKEKDKEEALIVLHQETIDAAEKQARGWRGPALVTKDKKGAEQGILVATQKIKSLDKEIHLFKEFLAQWEQTKLDPEERGRLLYEEKMAEFEADGGSVTLRFSSRRV
jgi:ABC-type Fe3+-hydroxamate transport system substrate-binding protein